MSRADDRKMKELAERLVAMSPEPPPYPEEVSVTQREDSKPRPALVFAGAALAVLLLAAIPILLSRGGGEVDPIASSTTSTVPTTVTTQPQASTTVITEQPATTTTVPATATTSLAVEPRNVFIFLTQSPENSNTGNPALVPFFATAYPTPETDDTLAALQLLTADELFLPESFESSIPDAVEVEGFTRGSSDQLVMVDMNEAFLDGAGGLLADMTMLNQLIFTAGDGEEIAEVLFTVGGQPITAFGSEGLDLTQPVGRDAFLDHLNSVNLDSAASGSGDAGLTITGFANVFEATVSLEVLDSSEAVVYQDFTTATCGTGCWGGFSFSADYPFVGGETIRVFWHSAEDGSPTDVVSVPVAWGDDQAWDFISHPGTP